MASTAGLSAMEALPPELLHRIFFYLDSPDIFSSRVACSIFAAIGIDHEFQNISICFKRQHFQRLLDVARHPTISKRVRSLHYYALRFNELLAFQAWMRQPRCTISASSRTWPSTAALSQSGLKAAYAKYVAIHRDQDRIVNERFDIHCFATLLRYCPNLDDITLDLNLDTNPMTTPTFPHTAFPEALADPVCDTRWNDTLWNHRSFKRATRCAQPIIAIAEVLDEAAKPIRCLGLVEVSHEARIIKPHLCPALGFLMRGLRELDISYFYHPDMDRDQLAWDDPRRAEALEREDTMADLPGHAPNLEVLKLRLTNEYDHRPLNTILGGQTWPNLRQLDVHGFATSEGYLAGLLARHASTLEQLSCVEMRCMDESCHQALRRVEGQMTELKDVRFCR